MSPSESDLRAALRDGEDDGRPDVDGLVAHAAAGRPTPGADAVRPPPRWSSRRGGRLPARPCWGGRRRHVGQQAGSRHRARPAPRAAPRRRRDGRGPAVPRPPSSRAGDGRPVCPAAYPDSLPGGGARARRAGRRCSPAGRTLIVCATAPGAPPASDARCPRLTGEQATALAASIERASRSSAAPARTSRASRTGSRSSGRDRRRHARCRRSPRRQRPERATSRSPTAPRSATTGAAAGRARCSPALHHPRRRPPRRRGRSPGSRRHPASRSRARRPHGSPAGGHRPRSRRGPVSAARSAAPPTPRRGRRPRRRRAR